MVKKYGEICIMKHYAFPLSICKKITKEAKRLKLSNTEYIIKCVKGD